MARTAPPAQPDRPDAVQPWYRQFWPWFVIALPTAVVIASIVTMIIAFTHKDSIVQDNYYKDGLAINQRLAQDERAAALGLEGQLSLDAVTGELRLALQGELAALPPALTLQFEHPLHATADFAVTLRAIGVAGDYRADLDQPIDGRWHTTLSPASGEWRLRQTIEVGGADRWLFGHD